MDLKSEPKEQITGYYLRFHPVIGSPLGYWASLFKEWKKPSVVLCETKAKRSIRLRLKQLALLSCVVKRSNVRHQSRIILIDHFLFDRLEMVHLVCVRLHSWDVFPSSKIMRRKDPLSSHEDPSNHWRTALHLFEKRPRPNCSRDIMFCSVMSVHIT